MIRGFELVVDRASSTNSGNGRFASAYVCPDALYAKVPDAKERTVLFSVLLGII